jgi:hypothetical protein
MLLPFACLAHLAYSTYYAYSWKDESFGGVSASVQSLLGSPCQGKVVDVPPPTSVTSVCEENSLRILKGIDPVLPTSTSGSRPLSRFEKIHKTADFGIFFLCELQVVQIAAEVNTGV